MRRGGKADLVIDHDMDRAAGAMPLEAREAKAFRHHALPGKGRIAMQQNGQNLGALGIVRLILLGADLAQHHRVYRFEMAGVGGQRQMDGVAVELAVVAGTEVVFHIARSVDILGFGTATPKLVEQRAVRLAHDIGQHVEPPAMRHPDDDVLHAKLPAALDDLLHRRDEAFATVKAKALGAHVFDMEVFLEPLGLDQLVQNRLATVPGKGDFLVVALDPLLEPGGLFGVGDVHVLQREGAAIGALDDGQDLAEACNLKAQHVVDENRPVHIGLGEAVGFRVKLGLGAMLAQAERVEIGDEMAADTVGANEHQRAHGIEHGALDRLVGNLDALLGGLGGNLLARVLQFRLGGPFARERGGELIGRHRRPVGPRP